MIATTNTSTELSVSIVLHNSSLVLLLDTLQSLQRAVKFAQDAGVLGRVTLFLTDNASDAVYRSALTNALAGWPESDSFQIILCSRSDNRGFGFGHNTVLQQLTSTFHLVLNPDVELQDDTLQVGLAALSQDDSIALLSPRVCGSDGEQEFLCKRHPSVLVLFLRGFAPNFVRRLFQRPLEHYEMRDLCAGQVPADVDIVSGCFMLMRTTALRAVGGFNEAFFLYFEDFDLSLRLATQGRLVFDPRMRIVHHGGYAANKGQRHLRYFMRSGILFFNRHGWRFL